MNLNVSYMKTFTYDFIIINIYYNIPKKVPGIKKIALLMAVVSKFNWSSFTIRYYFLQVTFKYFSIAIL